MPLQALPVTEATAGGSLMVLAIVAPAIALCLLLGLRGRFARAIVPAALLLQLILALAVTIILWRTQAPLVTELGGFAPPLGILLKADGVSALMMCVSAVIFLAAAGFAWADYAPPPAGKPEARQPLVFWAALLGMSSALSLLFTSTDLFTGYVGLELLTFAAIPLVCLKGSAETIRAALRYLLFAVFGSMLYLLGVVLLYGAYGTLNMAEIAARLTPNLATLLAAGLVTAGLLAKTALFPFHLWLPPAHAGAPAAGSAVLSALVVKGSLFLLMRFWFDAVPDLRLAAPMQLLALLGAMAVIIGSITALRQRRLKLLVAYSTVAQIGYMFFIFALAPAEADAATAATAWTTAWTGAWTQIVAHGFAKAGMFLAAGLAAEILGHDRIDDLGGLAARAPLVVLAFALAGLSLMGLPPSGGFNAKFLLLIAAVAEGQWLWALVIVTGGILAGAYLFRVLGRMFQEAAAPAVFQPAALNRQLIALGLALAAILMGLLPLAPLPLLTIGRAL